MATGRPESCRRRMAAYPNSTSVATQSGRSTIQAALEMAKLREVILRGSSRAC